MKKKYFVTEVTTSLKERGLNYPQSARRVHDRILVDDTLVRGNIDSDVEATNRCWLNNDVECLFDTCTNNH
jgi:hypothetical protein